MGYTYDSLYSNYTNDLTYLTGLSNATIIIDRETDLLDVGITIPDSVILEFVDSGMLNVKSSVVLTVGSPANLTAPPTMVIKTNSGDLAFSNGGTVQAGWFGNNVGAIEDAINSIPAGTVEFADQEFTIAYNESIPGKSQVNLVGSGFGSRLKNNGIRTVPMLELNGVTDIVVDSLLFDFDEKSGSKAEIQISGDSSNIKIQNCFFKDGYSGVWFNNTSGEEISHVTLFNNTFEKQALPVLLGHTTVTSNDSISFVTILGNTIRTASASGITFCQSVTDVVVEGNVIQDSVWYGLNMSYSGDRVSVIGNVIEGNKQGIYFTGIYPTDENWGKESQVVISGNIIRENDEDGIRVYPASGVQDWPYLIDISDNEISGNGHYGIFCRGSHINIRGNNVFKNAVVSGNYHGIAIEGYNSAIKSKYVSINNNFVVNNGYSGKTNMGIVLGTYLESVQVLGNTVVNDGKIDNDYQTHGIYIYGDTSEILLKNNRCDGHSSSDVYVTDGAEVQGETVSCKFGTLLGTDTGERPLFSAPSNICLLDAQLINASSVATNGSSYMNLSLRSRTSSTAYSTVMSYHNAATAGGYPMDAFVATSMTNLSATYKYLEKDNVLTLLKGVVGASSSDQDMDEVFVVLDYVTY